MIYSFAAFSAGYFKIETEICTSQNWAVTEIEQGKEFNTFHYTLQLWLPVPGGQSPGALLPKVKTALDPRPAGWRGWEVELGTGN